MSAGSVLAMTVAGALSEATAGTVVGALGGVAQSNSTSGTSSETRGTRGCTRNGTRHIARTRLEAGDAVGNTVRRRVYRVRSTRGRTAGGLGSVISEPGHKILALADRGVTGRARRRGRRPLLGVFTPIRAFLLALALFQILEKRRH